MNKVMKWISNAVDFLFPPIEFNLALNKRKKNKRRKLSQDEADDWATEVEGKIQKARKK